MRARQSPAADRATCSRARTARRRARGRRSVRISPPLLIQVAETRRSIMSREIASPNIELMSMARRFRRRRRDRPSRWLAAGACSPMRILPAHVGPSHIETAAPGRSSISPNDVRMSARFSRMCVSTAPNPVGHLASRDRPACLGARGWGVVRRAPPSALRTARPWSRTFERG